MKASEVVTEENAAVVKQVIEFLAVKPIADPMAVKLYALAVAVSEAEKTAEAEVLEIPTFVRRYLENKGLSCMYCDEGNVEGYGLDFEAGRIEQKVQCTDCGKTWIDIYKLSDVALFAEGE
jgi:hypothetical protein